MRIPVEYHIALKYLLAKRKQTFISIITFISVAGVAVGVMALVIVLAVMGGFQRELKDRILGATAHIHVTSFEGAIDSPAKAIETVRKVPGVAAATPYVFSQVMVSTNAGATGAVLRGIDPETVGDVTRLPRDLRMGRLSDLARRTKGDLPGAILGKELAANLGAGLGDVVEILIPNGAITPLGAFPRAERFRVAGIFESGMFEYDSSFVYTDLVETAKMLGLDGRITGIEVRVHDVYAAAKISKEIRVALSPGVANGEIGDYYAKDWMQSNKNLFSALELEKTVMFIILVLIVMVAAFNIISTLIMVVMEKTRDIAILMTMGATRRTIRRIFAFEGLAIGLAGTAIGIGLGVLLCVLLKKYQFIKLPSDVYYIATLPVDLDPMTLLLVAGSSVLICFLATLYPSAQAAKIRPAEAIRYE